MNSAALLFLSLTAGVGQPSVPSDVQVTKGRSLSLPIVYNPEMRREIQEARLFVSQDQGQTWFMKQSVLPTATEFVFNAKEDGLYYISMQLVFTNGKLDPPDISRIPPARKLLIDSTPPVVRIQQCQQSGDEIQIEWSVEDKFPNDKATVVRYRPASGTDTDWVSATETPGNKRSLKFKSSVAGPVLVQVMATDLAGNMGRSAKEAQPTTSSSYPPTVPALTPPTVPNPETNLSTAPVAPSMTPPAITAPSDQPIAPVVTSTQPAVTTQPAAPAQRPIAMSGNQPVTTNFVPGTAPAVTGVEPVAVQSQMIRTPRFELGYQLEGGPSGVARIDLYVTRDDGRTWIRWSTHAGNETPLKVILDTRFNPEVEGDYGFKLVPVSGAGLSDGAPTAGTAPEMKVHVDSTAPVIKVFQPTPDPNNRGALVLHWEATDRNFGKDPILIEYSETANGPWKPVTTGDGLVPVSAGANLPANRIANTGSYSWQLPSNLMTPHLHLKFTAWDNAGNKSEVVTPNPVLVDLTKPKAKIQGILPTNPGK